MGRRHGFRRAGGGSGRARGARRAGVFRIRRGETLAGRRRARAPAARLRLAGRSGLAGLAAGTGYRNQHRLSRRRWRCADGDADLPALSFRAELVGAPAGVRAATPCRRQMELGFRRAGSGAHPGNPLAAALPSAQPGRARLERRGTGSAGRFLPASRLDRLLRRNPLRADSRCRLAACAAGGAGRRYRAAQYHADGAVEDFQHSGTRLRLRRDSGCRSAPAVSRQSCAASSPT